MLLPIVSAVALGIFISSSNQLTPVLAGNADKVPPDGFLCNDTPIKLPVLADNDIWTNLYPFHRGYEDRTL